jgi:hypothetical protein
MHWLIMKLTIFHFQDQEVERYLGFFINIDPSGDGLAREILEYFDKYGIDYSRLELVGMDGTAVNTGYMVYSS